MYQSERAFYAHATGPQVKRRAGLTGSCCRGSGHDEGKKEGSKGLPGRNSQVHCLRFPSGPFYIVAAKKRVVFIPQFLIYYLPLPVPAAPRKQTHMSVTLHLPYSRYTVGYRIQPSQVRTLHVFSIIWLSSHPSPSEAFALQLTSSQSTSRLSSLVTRCISAHFELYLAGPSPMLSPSQPKQGSSEIRLPLPRTVVVTRS